MESTILVVFLLGISYWVYKVLNRLSPYEDYYLMENEDGSAFTEDLYIRRVRVSDYGTRGVFRVPEYTRITRSHYTPNWFRVFFNSKGEPDMVFKKISYEKACEIYEAHKTHEKLKKN